MRSHNVTALIPFALLLLLAAASACRAAAPTFQELMDPRVFPEAQRGMVVRSAALDSRRLSVLTTGARFEADLRRGELTCRQEIGHPRPVARLHLGRALQGGRLTRRGPGLAYATFAAPKLSLRVNGDSLLMLQAHEPLTVTVERLITPAWESSYQTHHLLLDEWGGFGVYCSESGLADGYDPYAPNVARYALPANAVLWIAVCPPKPYDWERSLKDNVVWHWSNQSAYPPDNVLRSWKPLGNTVLLQSEVMLWKDWELAFVPRLGPEEFARVRKTVHDLGMRFIVYTSPYYFLKGTALERLAINSFDNFKGWTPGTATGENIDLFMAAITGVVHDLKPDGLYFDGQYIESPPALYALARRTRALLGEEGILEWHSTQALGPHFCSLPQADAYVDFILRGEGVDARYQDFDYLRYFVSGYNVHNSIGVLCNNGPTRVTPKLAADVLRANARFHTLAGWVDDMKTMAALRESYQARLKPELRLEVEREADLRQRQIAAQVAARQAELDALRAEPEWGRPLLRVDLSRLPEGKRVVSPANTGEPFAATGGGLAVHARAHTYAFFSLPLSGKARGLVVKVRQGSDGGMSWGPGAALRFANRSLVRVGTRSDGRVQADVLGEQHLGGSFRTQEWVWLRARWLGRWGVVEQSDDGKRYTRLFTFEHTGLLGGDAAELLLGKVPYSGDPQDHSEPGEAGECRIGEVEVY